MANTTPNIGLKTFNWNTDGETLFENYVDDINGVTNSNTLITDAAVKGIYDELDNFEIDAKNV